MRSKSFTFLIIPAGKGKTYRFNVDSAVLLVSGLLCLMVVLATVFFSYNYFSQQIQGLSIDSLKSENENLSIQIDQMRTTIRELKGSYSGLVEREKAIRAIFDLPEISDQERLLGVGGPTTLDTTTLSPTETKAFITDSELEELVRLSSFETKQYKSIYDKVKSRKEELDHVPSIMPCEGYLTRGYGIMPHPISGFKSLHAGLDIANRTGTAVYATANGMVSFVGNKGRMGKTVVIDHGNGLKTMYGHLHKTTVRQGQIIDRSDKIGEMGSTGYSTGTHLHYSVTLHGQSVNPWKYILTDEMVTDHASLE